MHVDRNHGYITIHLPKTLGTRLISKVAMQTKLTKAEALKIVRRFVDEELPKFTWYQQTRSRIKATALYGPTAKGMNRPDSDIDILIFMPLAEEEMHTTGEYFYSFQNREINIVIRSIERLRKIAEEKSDAFQKEVFRESVVIESADDEVAKLLKAIQAIGGNLVFAGTCSFFSPAIA